MIFGEEGKGKKPKNYSGESKFWFSETSKKSPFRDLWDGGNDRIISFFLMELFFPKTKKYKKIQKFQKSQLFDFVKKSSIEKNLIIRSLSFVLKVPNLHFFTISEDQNFDSSE